MSEVFSQVELNPLLNFIRSVLPIMVGRLMNKEAMEPAAEDELFHVAGLVATLGPDEQKELTLLISDRGVALVQRFIEEYQRKRNKKSIDEILDGIEKGEYPDEPMVDIPPPFENDAGAIWNIARGAFGSASFIASRAGKIRSNHFHKEDSHFIYVVSGFMYYYWKPAPKNGACMSFSPGETDVTGKIKCSTCGGLDSDHSPRTSQRVRVDKKQLVFTGPGTIHTTYFPVDCEIVTLNKRARDKESHESDVVRVSSLITTEVCPAIAEGVRCCLPLELERDNPRIHPIHSGDTHESLDGQRFGFGMFGAYLE